LHGLLRGKKAKLGLPVVMIDGRPSSSSKLDLPLVHDPKLRAVPIQSELLTITPDVSFDS
jgi:hypothetical protein